MKSIYFCVSVFALFVICSGSCTSEPESPEIAQHQALEAFTSKTNLLSLSAEEQKQAWIAKLETYFQLDLNEAQKATLKMILADLKELEDGKFYLSENLRKDAVAMAKITPQDDFIKLFSYASTSLPVLTKVGPVCNICINDLENDIHPDVDYKGNVTLRTPDCNCSWTCQQQADNTLCEGGEAVVVSPCQGGQTEHCCNATAHGCGLLFIQSCDGYVECQSF